MPRGNWQNWQPKQIASAARVEREPPGGRPTWARAAGARPKPHTLPPPCHPPVQHKKDYATRRGLLQILGQRKQLLAYLQKEDK